MRKATSWTILTILFVFFVSCRKENNSTNASALSGNWTFMGFHAQTSSTALDTETGIVFKTVTTSDYSTTANGGVVGISGTTMTGTGITYSANMPIFVSDYEDNVIVDTFSTELPFSIPPTNSTTTFEVIGNDSIHYTSASLLGSGGSGTPAANGAKFSIAGNILILTENVVQDKIIDTLGVIIYQHETASVVSTLQKQ